MRNKNRYYTMALRMLKQTNPYKMPVEELSYQAPGKEVGPGSGRIYNLCELLNIRLGWRSGGAGPGEEERVSSAEKRTLCFQAIAGALVEYQQYYPAVFSYKQKLRGDFRKWLERIREEFSIWDQDLPPELTEATMEADTAVAMLKLLHNRQGLTRQELAEELGITTRAVQKNLRKLDSGLYEGTDLEDNSVYVPFRIGGQPVRARITARSRRQGCSLEEEGTDGETRRKYYYMANSVHPIVLQENMMQAGTLMRALWLNAVREGSEVSRVIALDVWLQLSDYARDKIRTCFDQTLAEGSFSEFLEELEDTPPRQDTLGFRTEREMVRAPEFDTMSLGEALIFASKESRSFGLILNQDGRNIELEDQIVRIRWNEDGIRSYVARGVEGRETEFFDEELEDIWLSELPHR